jgi:class 3 adenylate cyclase/pimeloyl-ACP methyl ester carboxylesterase
MDQQIRFCTTSDGVSIAYATVGSGPPLIYANGWPGHLALEWEKPFAREFVEAFASDFTIIRYDMRNSGLSETAAEDMSLDTLVLDLEAVADDLKLESFALMSLGLLAGPIAMTYAAKHPERVSKLATLGAFLRGDRLITEEQFKAMSGFVAAFGQLIIPTVENQRFQPDPEQVKQAAGIHEAGSSPEVIVRLLETMFRTDLTDVVPKLTMPVLVLHGSEDERVTLAAARELAARLPSVRFVPYEGTGGTPWADRDTILPEIFDFLGAERPPAPAPRRSTPAGTMVTILFTDMASSTALTQRLGDAKAQEIVRAHDEIVRRELAAHGGREIKHTGDGIMASFPTASGAVSCAIAIQRAVAQHADGGLQVRIGLNAGEPVAEEQDLFGTAVQLASRVCDRAESGEILVADVVRQLAAGKGFLFADRGEVLPKGFEEPVRLFEVRWRDEA